MYNYCILDVGLFKALKKEKHVFSIKQTCDRRNTN